jgi:hypothetical protein
MASIWPLLFFTFLSFLRKYLPANKRDAIVRNPHRKSNYRILASARECTALTRTWTWREPRWWPRASCGISWGAHRSGSAARDPPPGTDGTAAPKRITEEIRRSAKPGTANTRWIKTRGGGEDGGGRLTLWATISANSRGRRGGEGLLKPNREDGGRLGRTRRRSSIYVLGRETLTGRVLWAWMLD